MPISGPVPYRACEDLQVTTAAFPAPSEVSIIYIHYVLTISYLLGIYNHKKECQCGMLFLRQKSEIYRAVKRSSHQLGFANIAITQAYHG
jgi:hypothetical protein